MKLKKLTIYCLALFCASSSLYAQSGEEVQKKRSGNPIFPGWYADPEGVGAGREVLDLSYIFRSL